MRNRLKRTLGLRMRGFSLVLLVLGLLGLTASSVVSLQLWRAQQARLTSAFRGRLTDLAIDLDAGLDDELQLVDDLATTEASEEVFDLAEFHAYSQAVLPAHPEILGLGWAPVVPAIDRSRFERQVRLSGLPDFHIFDFDAQGTAITPDDRSELYPVMGDETRNADLAALGFNIGSEPGGLAGLMAAKASGQLSASGPVPLLAADGSRPLGILLTKFVTTRNTPAWQTADGPGTGYVSAILDVQPAIQQILASRNTAGLVLLVTDVTPGPANAPGVQLFQTPGRTLSDPPAWSTDLEIAGRIWRVSGDPSDPSALQPRTWEPFVALAVGGLITLLLVFHAYGQGQATQAIQREKERYLALVEHISDVILVAGRDGRTTYHNPASTRVLGYTSMELARLRPIDLMHAEDRAEMLSSRVDRRTPDPGTTSALVRVRHKDGHWVLCEAIVTNRLDTPAIAGVVITMRDVTERQRVEAELRQSQKMESVGRLAAGIAHEINTPIQFIGDNLHFLHDAVDTLFNTIHPMPGRLSPVLRVPVDEDLATLEAEVPAAIKESLDGVQRVASIVRALREFAHPDSSEQVSADLNQALRSTLMIARNELRLMDVQTDFGDLPPVWCHPGELNQVFLNLFVNAAHAVIDAHRGAAGVVRVSTRRDGETAVVSVNDNGTGIADEIQARVFDPFFTTRAVGEGSGQGLALARSMVVDKHHGSLEFTTTVGEGSTFIVRLPIAGVPAAHVRMAA